MHKEFFHSSDRGERHLVLGSTSNPYLFKKKVSVLVGYY